MADKRRLQGEIERCNKKVQEGCDTFDDIWEKFNTATQLNQKEKFESDLKREIKKLQRLRDQIKTWLNTSEIRDKAPLVENRKKIENRMERFKVVEKETKTKAYSKEGLGASTKLDPVAKEKREVETWLQEAINSLEIQADQMESEIETISTSGSKKRSKSDKNKEEKLGELTNKLERHKFHISQLELILRLLNNDKIEVKQIKDIKEDVDYYVESNADDSFEENEFMYDDLDLDELSGEQYTVQSGFQHSETNNIDNDTSNHSAHLSHSNANHSTSTAAPSSNHSKDSDHVSADHSKNRHRSNTNSDDHQGKTNGPSKPPLIINNKSSSHSQQSINDSPAPSSAGTLSVPGTPISATPGVSHSDSPFHSNSLINTASSNAPPTSATAANLQNFSNLNSSSNSTSSTAFNSQQQAQLLSYSDAAAPATSADQTSRPTSADIRSTDTPPQSSTPNSTTGSSIGNSVSNSTIPSPAPSPATMISLETPVKSDHLRLSSHQMNSNGGYQNGPVNSLSAHNGALPKMPGESVNSLRMMSQSAIPSQYSMSQQQQQHMAASTSSVPSEGSMLNKAAAPPTALPTAPTTAPNNTQTSSIRLSPLLGVAPLGPRKLTEEHHYQAEMLSAAFVHCPQPSDSERLRNYLPRNAMLTPSYYPQTQPPHNDTVEFFQRLSTEALFFIFYYMEGTKAQYLAAKALKKQSWRFHTKYMMWFQRHDEPTRITDEHESGTYIYFDYEKWGQRRKEGFTFEYKFLEDRDLN